jgi:hypothetical protein
MTCGSKPVSDTSKPVEVGILMFTVSVPGAAARSSGFGVKVIRKASTVMVTVAGALFAYLSFTIN